MSTSVKTRLTWLFALVGIVAVITLGVLFPFDRNYYFIALAVITLSMLPFLAAFEGRKPEAREIVTIAVLTALAVAGRAAFFMLPQFKPGMAIVILAGVGLGRESGFVVGVLHGFISNFIFGQGPWTPWQMFSYALCGFLAGVFFSRSAERHSGFSSPLQKTLLIIYGALATFVIYGLLVDSASVLIWSSEFTWSAARAIYLSGIPFNAVHAFATAVFLTLLSTLIVERLTRLKTRYGLFQPH
ncbi:MAG: ECF transporter S component [Propionibacteriaceae bacterium]|jgi:energy-coupling factor transport system substrate-specific component|nr:ECF transporter S component [Propionibacteriaceae bacterium]